MKNLARTVGCRLWIISQTSSTCLSARRLRVGPFLWRLRGSRTIGGWVIRNTSHCWWDDAAPWEFAEQLHEYSHALYCGECPPAHTIRRSLPPAPFGRDRQFYQMSMQSMYCIEVKISPHPDKLSIYSRIRIQIMCNSWILHSLLIYLYIAFIERAAVCMQPMWSPAHI